MQNPVGQEKQFQFVRVLGTTERLINLKKAGREGQSGEPPLHNRCRCSPKDQLSARALPYPNAHKTNKLSSLII